MKEPRAWAAPFHPGPVDAAVRLPGSKSLTNRYLVLAALGEEPARIHRPLFARDTVLMARGLAGMGAALSHEGRTLTLTPGPLGSARIQAGLAGTVMRFIPAVAAFTVGDVTVDGDPAARTRPMDPVVRALRDLGVEVEHAADASGRAVLPVTVHGTGSVGGGSVEIDASASSQFVSALLLAAPRMERGLDLRHVGPPVPSSPHIAMTVEVLRAAGIAVSALVGDGSPAGLPSSARPGRPAARWTVEPGTPRLGDVTVEADLSNAGPFLAAAMVTGGRTAVLDWPARTAQGGEALRGIFTAMGGRAVYDPDASTLRLQGPHRIAPLDADMHDVGELVPTVAAVAAFADGPSRLRNIGQLRSHETDRLAAIAAELARAGGSARIEGDDLVIQPRPLRGARLESYADHRMATFGAILGLRVEGIEVAGVETTAKTFPQFTDMWSELACAPGAGAAFDPDGEQRAPTPGGSRPRLIEPAAPGVGFTDGELPA